MEGKSEPACFSFSLSLDTNRWCFLVPSTNAVYIGTHCQDTKPAKSLLNLLMPRKLIINSYPGTQSQVFPLSPKQHRNCTNAMVSAALQLMAINAAKEAPGLGKKGS